MAIFSTTFHEILGSMGAILQKVMYVEALEWAIEIGTLKLPLANMMNDL